MYKLITNVWIGSLCYSSRPFPSAHRDSENRIEKIMNQPYYFELLQSFMKSGLTRELTQSRWRDIFYICFFLNVHTIDLLIVFFVKLLLNRYWVSRSLLLLMRRKFSKSRTSGFICLALNREHSRNEEIKLQKWYITQRVIQFQDVVRYLTLHVSK